MDGNGLGYDLPLVFARRHLFMAHMFLFVRAHQAFRGVGGELGGGLEGNGRIV
jgi:hypothetical protein